MAKIKLGQTRLSHVSESYTLPECTKKQGYEETFSMEWKRSYCKELNNSAWNKVCWKGEEKE